MRNPMWIWLLLLLASMGLNVTLLIRQQSSLGAGSTNQQLSTAEAYPYLSKRIFAENQNDILINFIPLRSALRQYVSEQPDQIGVYFEYLPSGTSIGVNDQLETEIASLIKIPTVMSIYKLLENNQLSKDTPLTIQKNNLDDRFGDLWQRGEGATLPLAEVISLTLMHSDNTAYQMLLNRISVQQLAHVFDSLDIQIHRESGEQFITISPKSYASIFRSLYLSSYLQQESSNEILHILTQTPFNGQIVASVPELVQVSHKIGVFDAKDGSKDTYSDCGIVYIPQRPYILCIMTKTEDGTAQEYMQHISKMVYGYVSRVEQTD